MPSAGDFPFLGHTLAQFGLLPLSLVGPGWVFKAAFCCLLWKDYLFPMNQMIHLHHLISTYGCLVLSESQDDMRMLGIAEFGSAICNVYLCAVHTNLPPMLLWFLYTVYAAAMTASNAVCAHYLVTKCDKHRWYSLVPIYALLCWRQVFLLSLFFKT
jgi:hypothetical protein